MGCGEGLHGILIRQCFHIWSVFPEGGLPRQQILTLGGCRIWSVMGGGRLPALLAVRPHPGCEELLQL